MQYNPNLLIDFVDFCGLSAINIEYRVVAHGNFDGRCCWTSRKPDRPVSIESRDGRDFYYGMNGEA